MPLFRFQRRLVNDIVWSFCWLCRNPEKEYGRQWPFQFSTWHEHLTFENSNYGTADYNKYRPFLYYSERVYKGPYSYYLATLRQLELYTAAWKEDHFQYAKELLGKYYGVPCDEL